MFSSPNEQAKRPNPVNLSNGQVTSKQYCGDVLAVLPELEAESVNCCVTSPPYYGLRDYGVEGQIGLEKTPEEYVAKLVTVFREVRRVLRGDGTLWLNLGDSYAGGRSGSYRDKSTLSGFTNAHAKGRLMDATPIQRAAPPGLKPKDLIGIPWRVAFALRDDGWYMRSDIIWAKPNPMPEAVTDRPIKAHEYVFLMSKSARYCYDADAVREAHTARNIQHQYAKVKDRGDSRVFAKQGLHDFLNPLGRNRRSVWTIPTQAFKGAHFATMPEKLVELCSLAGCPTAGTVLDPFSGAGTVAAVAARLGRSSIGIELNPAYIEMATARIKNSLGATATIWRQK
jgi:DNA modification methylase